MEQSNLLGPIVSYEENEVFWIRSQESTIEKSKRGFTYVASGFTRKHKTRVEMFARDKHSSLWWTLVNYVCNEFYNIEPRDRIHNTSFTSYFKNKPNKRECYITPQWKPFRQQTL